MGISYGKFFNFQKERRTTILMVGLEGAGKTTILNKLTPMGEIFSSIQQIGFGVEELKYKSSFNIINWDLEGEEDDKFKFNPNWNHLIDNINAIIFVIDSNDRNRISEAKRELEWLLKIDELKEIILLIIANKQDLPSSMTISEITEKLELHFILDISRKWFIQSACANNADGLCESFDWISSSLHLPSLI